MSHGRVVEQGTHEELTSKDGVYHSLYRIQELEGPDALQKLEPGE